MKVNFTHPQTGKPSTVVLNDKMVYSYFKARTILWGDEFVQGHVLGPAIRPEVAEWAKDYFVDPRSCVVPPWHCSSQTKTFTACCEWHMLITIDHALDEVYRQAVTDHAGGLGCVKSRAPGCVDAPVANAAEACESSDE